MPRGIKKKRARRASGTQTDAFYGAEPIFTGKITDSQLHPTLTWYNYTQDPEKGKVWLLDFMAREGYTKAEIQAVRRVNFNAIPSVVYWLSKIALNGTKLPKDTVVRFKERIQTAIQKGAGLKDPDAVKAKKKPPNIQERIKEKGEQLIADLEDALDNFFANKEKFSMYDFLQKNEVSSQITNMIAAYYQPKLDELNERDAQVTEAYGSDRARLKKFFNEWFSDIERYGSNRKVSKERKPRKKKEKLAVDVIKRLKYQKEFKPLKIVSVNPIEMIGAQQLWVYNTKYKQLAVYNAAGPAGISVKGTTLIGFDQEESEYKTLRKPEEQVAKLLSTGKIGLRKFMGEMKTKARRPNGRINENIVILKVIK
jgi:hypothetical protein